MINSSAVKLRMKALQLTQDAVASKMGLSQCVLSQKINNKRPMTIKEAEKLQEILKIPDAEFRFFFLTGKVA
ncbi:helix-turn-helix transcriptional regulator [Oscillibacter valericigenes]|nr:helix-turn-helix transcriptional regulator [Oscillibacter valericigenes]